MRSFPIIVAVAVFVVFGLTFMVSHPVDEVDYRLQPSQSAEAPVLGTETELPQVDVIKTETHIFEYDEITRYNIIVVIQNNRTEAVPISPGLQFWLRDSDGILNPYTAEYIDPQIISGGVVDPGREMKLQLDFNLSKSSSADSLIFDIDANSPNVEVKL